jgi:hypothetical protein
MKTHEENQPATAVLPDSHAAMSFAGWDESEARRRIATLLRSGWSVRQLALTFGVAIEEIDRLTGETDPPASVSPLTTIAEVSS